MRLSRSLLAACLLLACSDDGGTPRPTRSDGDAGAPTPRDAETSPADAAPVGASVTPAQPRSDAAIPTTPPDAGTKPTSDAAHYFPSGAFMYQRVDGAALDPDSPTITKWLADHGGWGAGAMKIDFSIEVLTADASTPRRAFTKTKDFYSPDCDFTTVPVPTTGALEGESGYACSHDGDCHLLVLAREENRLYEMWRANIVGDKFSGGCLAIWDTSRVYGAEGRGEQCTSADAGGFPIAPLLFSADEVAAGNVDHAVRFILPNERMRAKTYQHPGNHAGGPSGPADAPIYGSRWRLKSSFDLQTLPSEGARTVARALQQYGMVLADGGNIALTAQSDRYTSNKWKGLLEANDLNKVKPTDFEVVQTGEPLPLTFDCTRTPITQ